MTLVLDYAATWDAGSWTSLTLPVIINLNKTISAKNKAVPIRHVEDTSLTPIYIPLGYSPTQITFDGYFSSATTFNTFAGMLPDMIVKINSSDYAEFTVGEYYEVQSAETERSGCYNLNFKYNISLLKQDHETVR